MTTTLQPTLQSNRNYFLDVWRGFAITGVLLAYIMWNLGYVPQKDWTPVDKNHSRTYLDLCRRWKWQPMKKKRTIQTVGMIL